MQTDLVKAQAWGSKGGKKTLSMFGKAHFSKAAKTRWKKYKLTKKKHGKKSK
jgi:hypothetical protein